MFRRLSTIALITAVEYVVVAAILLLAISYGLFSPHSIGALGAGLAAAAALVGLLLGKRLGREEAEEEAVARAAIEPTRDLAAAAAPGAPRPNAEAESMQPALAPQAAPSAPASALSHAAAEPLLLDEVETIPIGFASLDRNLVIRAANPAMKAILRAVGGEEIVGLPLSATALGAAVYNGPRTALAGRMLHELAAELLPREGTLDLSRLLVPGAGESWAARLRARFHAWPARGARVERYFAWVEQEATAEAPSEEVTLVAPVSPSSGDREKLFDEILLRTALLAAIPVGVLLLDRRGALIGWSDAVETVLGAEIALREGMPVDGVWPPLGSPPHREKLAALLSGGAPFTSRMPAPASGREGILPREQIVRGVPVGVPGEAPRQFLIVVEERWDMVALASVEAELVRSRSRARTFGERLPEMRSRLDLIGSIARFLTSALSRDDARALSEVQMIDIQRDRIARMLAEIENPPPGGSASASA